MSFEQLLQRLEAALVCEGGTLWRRVILQGEQAQVDWPSDLPPLTEELRHWFAWHSTSEGNPGRLESWRSSSLARTQYLSWSSESGFQPSFVPVIDPYLVDVLDGTVWMRCVDEDGHVQFDRAPFPDLAALLSSMESIYAARRHSSWRRFRIDLPQELLGTRVEQVPEFDSLERSPVGYALLGAPSGGRWPRGIFALKVAPARWISRSIRLDRSRADECFQHAINELRAEFASGNDLEADITVDAVRERLSTATMRWSAKGPWELRAIVVRIWEQPSVSELLGRLERVLSARAPDVRRSLALSGSEADIVGLETDIRRSIPSDLRALWQFADGQSAGCGPFYWGHNLMSVRDARRAITTMRELATTQFGDAYWGRAFVPFLDRGNGDHVCVDVAGAYGPEGCVVDFDHTWPERRSILFDSVTEWLECFVDGLEAGLYVAELDGVFPRGFLATGSLEEIRRHEDVRTNGRYPWERHLRLRLGP